MDYPLYRAGPFDKLRAGKVRPLNKSDEQRPQAFAMRAGSLYFTHIAGRRPETRWSGHLDRKVYLTFLTACGLMEGLAFDSAAGSRHCQSVSMRSIGRLCIFKALTLHPHSQEKAA
jgi:hypothetical protein